MACHLVKYSPWANWWDWKFAGRSSRELNQSKNLRIRRMVDVHQWECGVRVWEWISASSLHEANPWERHRRRTCISDPGRSKQIINFNVSASSPLKRMIHHRIASTLWWQIHVPSMHFLRETFRRFIEGKASRDGQGLKSFDFLLACVQNYVIRLYVFRKRFHCLEDGCEETVDANWGLLARSNSWTKIGLLKWSTSRTRGRLLWEDTVFF